MEKRRFLIVGSNVRNVVESGKKAGFEVFALTNHDDADLELYADGVFLIERKEKRWVRRRAEELSESLNAEVVCGSGYEDLFDESLERILNKRKFYRELDKIGIDYPEFLKSGERGILKPERGGGGEGVIFGSEEKEGYILQRYIEGIPCSVSVLSDGKRARALAVNRMIVGDKRFNADHFKYCGNITPFKTDAEKVLRSVAEELVKYFELSGNVGVDFVLSEKAYVLEINPRFQGSLDSIEWSYNCNLFRMHVDAMEGRIEECKPERYAGRAIVFADREVVINSSPVGNPFFSDIPKRGKRYSRGEAVVSVLSSGSSEKDVFKKLVERKNRFMEMIC